MDRGSAGSPPVAQGGTGGSTTEGGATDQGLAGGNAGELVDGGAGGASGAGPAPVVPTFEVPTVAASPVDPIINITGYAWAIAVGDTNADGHLDLVSGRDFDGAAVALGKGDGTFHFVGDQPGTKQPGQKTVFGLSLADFDRDGDLDLAIASSFPGQSIAPRIGLLSNDGSGAFGEAKEFLLKGQAELGFGHIASADFNADGWLDIAAGSGASLNVLLNDH
ncbi:MAG: VCBS repeat-containing protein, partial [Myxococcales bacterium]